MIHKLFVYNVVFVLEGEEGRRDERGRAERIHMFTYVCWWMLGSGAEFHRPRVHFRT